MAQLVVTNAKLYLAGYDLSGDLNQTALAFGAEALDDTTFGDTTRSNVGGLKTAAVEARGLWNGGANADKAVFDRIGTVDVPLLVAADGGDAGDECYFLKAMAATYQVGGQVGEVLPFDLSASATGGTPMVRGSVLFNGTAGVTANGTGYQNGAVASGKKLYAGLWIIDDPSGTSPTLDVKIQSDDNSGFTSALDRITFTQATTRGAQFATPVSGSITDTYWRAVYTIGGTTPSFRFAVVMGIL